MEEVLGAVDTIPKLLSLKLNPLRIVLGSGPSNSTRNMWTVVILEFCVSYILTVCLYVVSVGCFIPEIKHRSKVFFIIIIYKKKLLQTYKH